MPAEYFNANPRYKALAQDLIDAEPKGLGHIDLDLVLFLEIREVKPKQAILIKKINEPFVTLLGKTFYLAINEDLMSEYDQEHQELAMLRILLHFDVEPGKMKFPEVFEFRCILDNFGPDWKTTQIQSPLSLMQSGQQIVF